MERYSHISSKLLEDSDLSLRVEKLGYHYGITGIRQAAIWGRNPNAGKTVGDGEMAYIEEDSASLQNLKFRGRETMEALNLLERACAGEKGLEDTVSSRSMNNDNIIQGYSKAIPGLDQWIFWGTKLIVRKERGDLTANMAIYDTSIASQKIRDIGEAISLYQENTQYDHIVRSITKGAFIRRYLLKNANLKSRGRGFDRIEMVFTPFMRSVLKMDLKKLSPLNISKSAQEAMFTTMVLDSIYKMQSLDELKKQPFLL